MELQSQNIALIQGHLRVAGMAYRSGEYHAAFRNLNSAVHEIEEAHAQLEDLDHHELKRLFGKVELALGMYKQAEQAFREAIDLGMSSNLIPRKSIISNTRHLADCVRLRGKLDEAESLYQQSIAQLEEPDSKVGSQLAKAYMGLAQVYLDAQRLPEAEKALTKALEMFENNPGERSFWFGISLVTLARLRCAQGNTIESKDILQQSLTILEPLLGPHHPIRALVLGRLANILNLEGNEQTASMILSELKEVEKYLKDHDT